MVRTYVTSDRDLLGQSLEIHASNSGFGAYKICEPRIKIALRVIDDEKDQPGCDVD